MTNKNTTRGALREATNSSGVYVPTTFSLFPLVFTKFVTLAIVLLNTDILNPFLAIFNA